MGILSQSEVLAGLDDLGVSALAHCATGVMRRPPPSVGESETLEDAMRAMTRQRARHLIVLDAQDGLQGIVSMGDLVAAKIGATELEASVLRDLARSRLLAD